MEPNFIKRLEEYLSSECSDYDMSYSYETSGVYSCEVEIKRNSLTKLILFRYSNMDNNLYIELSDGSFYETREFDETVKYFWMLISPSLFPDA